MTTDDAHEPFVAVAMPDIATSLAISTSGAARTAQATAAQAVNIAQKIKEFALSKQQWLTDKLDRARQHLQVYGQRAFQFAQTMKMVSLFFPIVVVFRMVIGFFQKPLEFIMLGVSCLIVSVLYCLHFVFSIPPFDWVPFAAYFGVFELAPLAAYTAVFGGLFLLATVMALVLAAVNYVTGGALKRLVLCQNSPAAWYKTPNHHLQNQYERGLMCSRPCRAGYAPDPDSRSTCKRLPIRQPSFCPQAGVMRAYMREPSANQKYPDYVDLGGWRNATSSRQDRRDAMKGHYMAKRSFLQTCRVAFSGPYETVPLSVCAATDASAPELDRVSARACAQAFCDGRRAYPFCGRTEASAPSRPTTEPWWLRLVHGSMWLVVAGVIVTVAVATVRRSG